MQHRGFTLVEVLVALVAFSMLAFAGGAIASSVVKSREDLKIVDDRIQSLQTARAIMRADLAQAVLRPIRDSFGGRGPFSFDGRAPQDEKPFLMLVRGGWINPGNAEERSTLQAVEYSLEDGVIVRRLSARLDPTPDTPSADMDLLRNVERAKVEFYSNGVWMPEWRVPANVDGALPEAVAIELQFRDLGTIRQVFRTSAL